MSIQIETSREEAFFAMDILLQGFLAEGLENEYYEDAEECLKEMYKIFDNGNDSRLSRTLDEFLIILQLKSDYNDICRAFRYYYGYGIYSDKDYRAAVIKMINYIRTDPQLLKKYNDTLNYALTYFSSPLNFIYISNLRDLTLENISSEYKYLSYEIADYVNFWLEEDEDSENDDMEDYNIDNCLTQFEDSDDEWDSEE